MHEKNVVVSDPLGKVWTGSIVTGAQTHSLEARGVVLLPCNPELFGLCGVGGFAKREWGWGWPLGGSTPSMNGPLAIYLPRDVREVHWAVRLASVEGDDWKRATGSMSFSDDRGQRAVRAVPGWLPAEGKRQIQPRELGEPDAAGGWTWKGSGQVQIVDDAIYGFALYGVAPGLRLLWAAVSATT